MLGVGTPDWTVGIDPAPAGARVAVVELGATLDVALLISSAGGGFQVFFSRTLGTAEWNGPALPDIAAIVRAVIDALRSAGITSPNDLHALYLSGLPAYIPAVQNEFRPLCANQRTKAAAPQQVSAPSSSVPTAPRTVRTRNWAIAAMAGAVVLVLIAIGAVVIRQQQDSTNPFQSIQVGSTYGYSRAACDSVTGLVYVTNDHDRTVSVVDPAKGTATATIKLADDPEGIAVDPDLHRLYVVGKGAEKGIEGTLIVIDTMTNAVVDTVTTGHSSWGVTVDSGTHSVYVTNLVGLDYNPGADGSSEPNTESSVVVIDPVTASITASIPVGYNAMNLAIDAASRTAYVTGDYHDSTNHSITGLVKVDLATNAVTGQIGLPAETHGVFDVAIDQGARTAYVTSTEQTFVIDLAAGALTGSISISGPGFLGVDPGKHAVYVTGFSGQLQAIKVIDTEKHAVTTTIRAGSKISLRGLVVDPRTHTVYGLDFDQVVVIPR